MISTRRTAAIFATALLTTLTACGGSGNDPTNVDGSEQGQVIIMGVSLNSTDASGSSAMTTKAAGDNLVDLSGTWSSWSGEDNGINYDEGNGLLRIPGDGSDVVLGVNRFDTPLTEGTTYTFEVDASNTEAAAVLFLFDTNGAIVAVPGSDGLATAKTGAPITFTAPADIAGFYLQVQNQYQANEQTNLTAGLIEGESVMAEPTGENLINANGPWLDWSGDNSGISGADGTVTLPAPLLGMGNTVGVMQYNETLVANSNYELAALNPSDEGTSVLLFLFDANSQLIPFAGDSMALTWLAASPGNTKSFTVPAGVAGYAIQVQSPYGTGDTTRITPSMLVIESVDLAAPQSVVRTSDDGGHVLFDDGSREWMDNACVAKMAAMGKTVPLVPWEQIRDKPQTPGVAVCSDVIAADPITLIHVPEKSSLLNCIGTGVSKFSIVNGTFLSRNGADGIDLSAALNITFDGQNYLANGYASISNFRAVWNLEGTVNTVRGTSFECFPNG